MEVLVIIAVILYAAGALCWNIFKWVNYGIFEHNLLRCLIHSALTPIWPIVLAVYAVRRVRRYYYSVQLEKDYAELFLKAEPEAPKATPPPPIEDKRYTPGDWIN